MTTTVLNTKNSEVKKKIPDRSALMTTNFLIKKIGEVENKIPDHAKDITTAEFNKLAAENIAGRLKQANLVAKTDFDDKLTSLNRKMT